MSELHKFLFEGVPVRGMLVRLTEAWQEVLRRRGEGDPFEAPVRQLMGEMAAAGVLMQANIKFDGAVILQIFGDGPVKLAVAEVQPDLGFRTTAKVMGELPSTDSGHLPLDVMVNAGGEGRCAITLDPKDRQPGQQPYQGVVALRDRDQRPLHQLSEVLEHYMRQSEQLETRLVLAANDEIAAGLLIQRLPLEGAGNLAGQGAALEEVDLDESFNRISHLAASLTRQELLTLDADTLLRRLFWEENLLRFDPLEGERGPRFQCTCSRDRVAAMLRSLGNEEVQSILQEQSRIEVGCDFCGERHVFDAVDAGELFTDEVDLAPGPSRLQ